MLLQEKQQESFKQWLIPKLENISDADAGVLADYVIALVVADDSLANIKRSCIESLEDFLNDYTAPLVEEIITGLKNKSYLPSATAKTQANGAKAKPQQLPAPQSAPIPSIVGSSNFQYEPHPTDAPIGAPREPATMRASNAPNSTLDRPTAHSPLEHTQQQDGARASRKRKVVEVETSQSSGSNRPAKQTARSRGGRKARGGGIEPQTASLGFPSMPNFANLPPPPPGPLPIDPSNPMAFFAMAAAFGANLPGMPPFPGTQGNNQNQQGPKRRCRDYHDRGFCAQGMFCPYKHGDAVAEVPEYDPEKSHLAVQSRNQRQYKSSSRSFPNTKLIVEQIPEEHLNEEAVRDYFAQFGNIAHVQVHIYKGLAVVEFEDRAAAEQAWHCPKAVFDNRFVKVFWYKPERLGELAYDDAPMDDVDDGHEKLDFEEIAKRQAEAQKAFEERRRKKAEAAARAAEVEKLLKEKNDEIEQIKRQLAELSKDEADEFSQSLATLQAEAEDLFAQHDPAAPSDADRGAFRGGYRGRGSFPPRGRGAYRGRGGFGNASRFAMKKLDNRPRRLAVSNIQADSPRDEALRQHLLNIPDCTSIERHPQQPNTLILTFNERYQAEEFLDESLRIPDIGRLDLAWIPNEAFGGLKSTTPAAVLDAAAPDDDDDDDGSSATIGDSSHIKREDAPEHTTGLVEQDMDVADDVDQWL